MIAIRHGETRLWSSTEPVPATASEWVTEGCDQIRDALLNTQPAYPCHFAAIGERGGGNHYTYVDTRHNQGIEMDALAPAVARYLAEQAEQPLERRSLLILVGPTPPDRSLDWYRDLFWGILSELSARDEQPLPPGMPADPDDPSWNFSFAGESLFVFGTCPAYGPRRSRVLADCLVIALQSRSVFYDLSGTTEAGRAVKRRIRRSLADYDDVPLIADAGDGLGSTVEKWKQYMPDVDGKPTSQRCPFRAYPRSPSSRTGPGPRYRTLPPDPSRRVWS
jgi:FPC/CPF motif-containing protein YcgG